MAENKKSFLLYCDLIHTVEKMPNDKAGELLKHILKYVNDENPETEDLIIQLTFEPIKQSLKRDLIKYEQKRIKNTENANKRWNKENANASERIKTDAKDAVSDSVSVSDSVITSNNIITIDEAILICLEDDNWKKEIERIYKVDTSKVHLALAEFKSHCITTKKDTPRAIGKFCEHFTNWVRVKKQYQK
jgi:hypothetical protein